MRLFDLFKKKNTELTQEQQQWNAMWDLWAQGKATSPYAELMTYQSEVENGGHDQYFVNIENTSGLQKEMSVFETVLPSDFKDNLTKAYEAYLILQGNEEDENAQNTLEQCDNWFYGNDEKFHLLLQMYADTIRL